MNDGLPWRRLERSEPPEQRVMSLMARGIRDYLLRFPSDSKGVLFKWSNHFHDDMVVLLGARPSERENVVAAVEELFADGYLVHDQESGFVLIRNFAEHQSCANHNDSSKQSGSKSLSALRKSEYRRQKRQVSSANPEAQQSTDETSVGQQMGHVPQMSHTENGTCPTNVPRDVPPVSEDMSQKCPTDVPSNVPPSYNREEKNIIIVGHVPSNVPPVSHGTCPTETITTAATTGTDQGLDNDSAQVPCPSDLRLTEAQTATLETALVPRWAIDALTTSYVSSAVADPNKRMPLMAWRKCLAKAITGNWNDPRKRPKRPEQTQTVIRPPSLEGGKVLSSDGAFAYHPLPKRKTNDDDRGAA